MTTSENFVRFDKVDKSYDGEILVVKDLNLDVPKGEFLTMLGPSGSGKTTVLMMLAGFETPTSGEIYLDGNPISSIPPNKRGIGMVFQNYALFPHMTVKENLAFPLEVRKMQKSEIEEKVSNALSMVELQDFGSRMPLQLSGGQQQRVALARSLVFEPRLVFMDEPLGALDKKLREEMQLELRNLQRSIGITFIFVTHDQEEAMTMSDRVAVMNKGKILQISPPRDLYDNPKNLFVGDFIGQINFLDTQIVKIEGNNAKVLINKLGEHEIMTSNNNLSQNESIVCAIRPETIIISKTNEKNSDICIKGSIVNTSFYGNMTYVYVKIEGLSKPIMVSTSDVLEGLSHNSDCYLNINLKDIRIIQKN